MGISVGIIGLGAFGSAFADLFKEHPAVDRIALCDREPERVKKYIEDPFFQDKFDAKDAYGSLDEICKSDLDALVIITQPWLHAQQCIQVMESGKHVWSAVPISCVPDGDEILDWCDRIIDTCVKTGQHYMLAETTYYHPEAMFCRRKAAEGAFGRFVYAEGDYCHDVDAGCNLRQVSANRAASAAGKEWDELRTKYRDAGIQTGPMHYPTHSTSGPVCVMNAHAVKVTAYGYRHRERDPFFDSYSLTNEFALFKMSNGATVRIVETREAAGRLGDSAETFRIMGTTGTFSEGCWFEIERPDYDDIDLDNLPEPVCVEPTREEMFDKLPPEVAKAFTRAMNKDAEDVQNMDFVPKGHGGSHPYLVHEFCDSVANSRMPVINAWEAARYMAMGVTAHKSAQLDGERLDVPDWGDAPA